MKLGEIIREYRLSNKMSMGDFAKISGISKPYVSMLEANKNSNGGKPIAPELTQIFFGKAKGRRAYVPVNRLQTKTKSPPRRRVIF